MSIKPKSTKIAATVGNSLTMPDYPSDLAADDRIVVILSANGNVTFTETTTTDFGSAESSSTSYAEGISIGVFERKATASETPRTFGHSGGSIEYSMRVIILSGVDTTTAIEAQTGGTYSNSSGTALRTPPQVTTSGANRFMLVASCVDANAVPVLDPTMMSLTPEPFMNAAGGNVGAAVAVGWTIQASSGLSTLPDVLCAFRDSAVIVTMAFKPANSADAPPYVERTTGPYTYVALLRANASTAPFYSTGAFDPTTDGVSTIDGDSTTYDAIQLANKYGLGGQSDAIGIIASSAETGMRIAGWGIDSVDLSGKNLILHPSASLAAPFDTQANNGFAFGLRSGAGKYRFFNTGGSDSVPNQREGWTAVIIDVDNSANSIQDVGTFDSTLVDGVVPCSNKALSGTTTTVAVSDLAISNRITLIGGSSSDPIKMHHFEDAIKPFGTFPNPQETMQPLGIGDGSTACYFYSPNDAIGPYKRSDDSSANNQTDAGYSADLLIKATANCTIKLDDSIWNGDGSTPFEIDASSSASATYSWSGAKIISRAVTLRDVLAGTESGVTFSSCKEIIHNSADISGGYTIDNVASGEACAIRISGSTQAALQAELDKKANGVLTNNTNAPAFRVDYTGSADITLTFSGFDLSGNTTDLEFNATDAAAPSLTANMTNGSNFSQSKSIVSGTASSVTIKNDVTFTANISVSGAEATLLQRPSTTTVIDHQENPGTTYSYTYTYSSDQNAVLRVFKEGYVPFWDDSIVLGNTAQSVTVTLVPVPASQN